MLHFASVNLFSNISRLHLSNKVILGGEEKNQHSVHKNSESEGVWRFGFHTATCCGCIPQLNDWCDSWEVTFCSLRIHDDLDVD